ncbi:DUF4231 domain-containing protein [Saccharothrix longispora]|uniref:SMODS and SLOG-associating 2TM effector domain-containing protein n=1 Tax=Saccharothrix longispora TaxID=33920 RepID=A0ABU1PP37_9PSEU|nr:DUF4231 domain-containing protein [Saccharothrix longispora]MDR6592433.1 hypothetical protein [Saccharothrix longispora]
MPTEKRTLTDDDLPALFHMADAMSQRGQRAYLHALGARLVLAVLAAVFGVFALKAGEVDVAAVGTGVSLLVMLLVELHFRGSSPEATWYDGRALAESAKSMGWRYAVGGSPFPLGGDEREVTLRFVGEMAALLKDGPNSGITLPGRPTISPAMRDLRAADLATRRDTYVERRIRDQEAWYASKSDDNGRKARRAQQVLYAFATAGIVAAFARAFGVIGFDLAGVAGALIAAAAAWSGTKQYSTLARAYAYASQELGIVKERLELLVTDEATWAAEVADAEEAISREHTMWRASRTRAAS